MKLSVIIVNYNVEHFLDQCLTSVEQAIGHVEGEIIVVDNCSVDGSIPMIKSKHPDVLLIENDFNAGFSKANNIGIQRAKGEYILLLNPDTVVEEDTFSQVVAFMDEHPDAGGLGVKMVDGKGKFLPESKRGLPTPEVAFYKIFGFSALFPRSKRFGKYHLGYLDREATHKVDVLSGAFMLLRKEALDKVGLLDETFFMYGEDIDLSYRIIKGGYQNYYYPGTRIIHYKGESTKKSSVNYVFVFYRAMVIFARKHFHQDKARAFALLINFAIWFRASIALFSRMIQRAALPAFDMALITAGLFGISELYQHAEHKSFPSEVVGFALPSYAFIWFLSVFYTGGYDKPVRWYNLLKGVSLGTLIILAGYAMLNKEFQFSRIIIVLGGALTFLYYLLSRLLFRVTGPKGQSLSGIYSRRFAIIGQPDEAHRVREILDVTLPHISSIDFVLPTKTDDLPQGYCGHIGHLEDVIAVKKINEVVFCARDISVNLIIRIMSAIDRNDVDFKIAQPDTLFLIGSNSIHRSGDLYMLDVNGITKPSNKRIKRLLDLVSSFLFLLLSPVLMWFMRQPLGLPLNCLRVLSGKFSWVGYGSKGQLKGVLPKIRKGVVSTAGAGSSMPEEVVLKLDQIYARNYQLTTDIKLISSNFRHLGNKV